jgi:hypothetical protein
MRFRMSVLIVSLATFTFGPVIFGQEPQPSSWEKEPADFRGVPFGVSQKEAKALLKGLSCFSKEMCTAPLDLGGEVRATNYFLFEADKLVWVAWDFSADKWDFVRDVLIERYGEPMSRKQEPIQTRAGVEYLNESLGWTGEHVVITADHYGSKVTEGGVYIALKSWYEKKNAEKEEAKKKAANAF